MNEERDARKFAEVLDALLRGEEAGGSPDPKALEAARLLAETDFSKETDLRRRLRARLSERRRPAALGAWWLMPCAAAALLLFWIARPAPRPDGIREFIARESGRGTVDLRPGRPLPRPTGADALIAARGVVVQGPGVRSVRWELNGNLFVLEARAVTLDDIFERPKLASIVSIE